MPSDVLEVTKKFMRDPIRILVKKEELTLEGIKQFFVLVDKEVLRIEEAADRQTDGHANKQINTHIKDITSHNRIAAVCNILVISLV